MKVMMSFTKMAKEQGLSLIELMISLALGVILTLGVVQIFLGSSQTYRLTDSLAVLQENMRFVMGNLQHDARMAGYKGCLVGDPANLLNQSHSAYDPNLFASNAAAMGWEAGSTGLGDDYTISSLTPGTGSWSNGTGDSVPTAISGDVVPGTDILVVQGAVPANVTLDDNPKASNAAIGTVSGTNTGIAQGTIILAVSEDCSGGDLFQKSNQANSSSFAKGSGGSPGNANPSGGFSVNGYTDDASVYLFGSTAFYIGQGANGEPALFRERLDPGDPFGGAVELVAGVENMQLLFGVANNIDMNRRADQYLTAANVTDWGSVVSIRMALLMRSEDNVVDTASAGGFNLVGTEIDTAADRRARLVSVSTIGIRNRLE